MRLILVLLAAAALAAVPLSHEWLLRLALVTGFEALKITIGVWLMGAAAGTAIVVLLVVGGKTGEVLAARTGVEPHVWHLIAIAVFAAIVFIFDL